MEKESEKINKQKRKSPDMNKHLIEQRNEKEDSSNFDMHILSFTSTHIQPF